MTDVLLHPDGLESFVEDLVVRASRLTGTWVAVTLRCRDGSVVTARSDERTAPHEPRPRGPGPGPADTCWSSGDVVVVADLATDPRWPAAAGSAAPAIRSMTCLPVEGRDAVVGVLQLCSPLPGRAATDEVHDLGLGLAGQLSGATALARRLVTTTRAARDLLDGLVALANIERAVGVLVRRRGMTPDDAREELAALASAGGTSPAAVAGDLLHRDDELRRQRGQDRPA